MEACNNGYVAGANTVSQLAPESAKEKEGVRHDYVSADMSTGNQCTHTNCACHWYGTKGDCRPVGNVIIL